jgi:hypothetical protein
MALIFGWCQGLGVAGCSRMIADDRHEEQRVTEMVTPQVAWSAMPHLVDDAAAAEPFPSGCLGGDLSG